MLNKFSAKQLLTKLQSFKENKFSQLSRLNFQSLKDALVRLRPKSPFIITVLISIVVHSLLLTLPIFSSQNSVDKEDSEQIADEDNLENEEDEGIDEKGNLEVDELPPLPSDLDDENSDTLDENDDISDNSVDESADDITDESADDITDESTDDITDESADESTDDIISDSGEDSTDVSDTQIVNADVVDEVDTPSEPDPEPETEEVKEKETAADTQSDTETTPENETSENEIAENETATDLFSEAAKYQNIQPLLCGLKIAQQDKRSLQTSDPLNKVSAYFDKNLVEKGYQPRKIAENSSKKVYQISKDGQSRFLHLFSKNEAGTVILISQKRLDCYSLNTEANNTAQNSEDIDSEETQSNTESIDKEDSQNDQDNTQSVDKKDSSEKADSISTANAAVEVPSAEQAFESTLVSLNKELAWEKATIQVNQENSKKSEIEEVFSANTDKTPDELASLVNSKLNQFGFETSLVKNYPEGLLFKVKKGDFTKYITFIPKEDKTKIVITSWKKSPMKYQ